MMRSLPLRGVLAAALAAALSAGSVHAQWINPGTEVGSGDDVLAAGLALGFSFPMPDGSMVTTIDVDSNGRVFETGADTPDFSESVAELVAGPSTVCALWDDLVADNGIFFYTLPGVAVVTWVDVREFGGSQLFTVQAQLFQNGTINVLYDSRTPASDSIVGVSDGVGPDPGPVDLSAGFSSNGNPTVYELFTATDLGGNMLTMTPDGSGGYQGGAAPIPDPTFAEAVVGRAGCIELAITWTPDGSGGYVVTDGGTPDWNYEMGTPQGMADDSVNTVALGFMFPMPGGNMVNSIDIDSNGRIFEVGTDTSDFTPTTMEFLGNGATVAAYWTDLNPAAGGEVYFSSTANTASVTWAGVPKFGGTLLNTIQLRLFPNGSMQMIYIAPNHEQVGANSDLLVGVTPGAGAADPGSSDLTSLPIVSAGVSTVYEFFDVGNGAVVDIDNPLPGIEPLTQPILGNNFDVGLVNAPMNTAGVTYRVGFPTTLPITVRALRGCVLLSDGVLGSSPVLPPGTALSLPLPNNAALAGAVANLQGIVVVPGINPASVVLTNEVVATLGN